MKRILLSGIAVLAFVSASLAQTHTYTANLFRQLYDAPAGTATATGLPHHTIPANTFDVTCVENAVKIKGKASPSGPKNAYGDFFQLETYNGANPAMVATTYDAAKKFVIKLKSTGSYNPPITIQIKDAGTPTRVIDHLAAINATSTSTEYVIDLTNKLSQKYQGSGNGPLDSTKLAEIFISIDHGTATSVTDIPNIDIEIEYLYLGDITTSTEEAAANITSSSLYPNPTSEMAKVELNLKSQSSVKVTLSDLMGKEVMTIADGNFAELTKEFSVANLNKGIYTVNYFVNGSAAKAEMLMVK